MPVVDEMMDDVESGKTWTLSHVPETITRLIRGLNEVACLVPDSFYEVSFMRNFQNLKKILASIICPCNVK